MRSISAHPRGERLETVVFVARDRATGLVHGTYTHSYLEGAESDDQKAVLDRWTAELRERLSPAVDLHVATLQVDAFNADEAAHLHRPVEPSEGARSGSNSINRP